MVKKWFLLPKLIHILTARHKNKSLINTVNDEEIHRLVLYGTRHHVHSFLQ